jgi:membrane fusion protein (multidrug efflux system)
VGLHAGCGAKDASGPAAQPIEVGVVTVEPSSITLHRELPGRTTPFRVAEVRARVNGIVVERLFEEGSDVKRGQILFRIDPEPYRAALDSAKASLARAEASAESARLLESRYADLLKDNAVSQQEYDNAAAAAKAALAEVAAGKAAVRAAEINLGYTRVTSPIDGRIGKAEVTEGAYVQQAQATLMATVQQLDPIYVDLTQSTTELMRLRKQLEEGSLVRSGDGAKVRILLEDGTLYPHEGSLQFSDVTVNPSTGSVTIRALVPNPDGRLLPGMFVRAQLEEGTREDAILVPQIALRRDAQGRASVFVVGADGKVELRPVEAPRAVGNKWLVTEGLAPGERIVVEGLQKVRPGSTVTAVPAVTGESAHASR